MYIRKISIRRLEEYKKLRLAALLEHPEAFGSSYEEEVEMSDKKFKERLSNPENVTLGAFKDRELVGMITLITSKRKKTYQNGHIVSMIVSPLYRKQGIGQKLLEAIFIEARNLKIENLFLSVTSTNYPAINMYKKMGFRRYATEMKAIKVDETYFDSDLMALYLS